MEINILYRAKSLDDFTLQIQKAIKHLDGKIFQKPAKVSILKSNAFLGAGGAAFSTKKWFFRLLGLPDDYFVFKTSKHLEALSKLEDGAICCASHEVRHRFQHYNKNCLITVKFAKQNFSSEMINYLYREMSLKYGKDQNLFDREFDASLLESLIANLSKHPKITIDFIIRLIKCDENSIKNLLSELK